MSVYVGGWVGVCGGEEGYASELLEVSWPSECMNE